MGAEERGQLGVLRDQRCVEGDEAALLDGVGVGGGVEQQLARHYVAERGRGVRRLDENPSADHSCTSPGSAATSVPAASRSPRYGAFRSSDTSVSTTTRSNIPTMVGVVLVLLTMFLVGPIGLFVVATLWSAVFGWLPVEDAENRPDAAGQPSAS